ncbi:MAG TPA: phosphate ABC transporter substrate-binding protein PstS [Gaiellaceae bacterium]|jgi:phosphate transport system substrate-binding protein
MLKKKTLLAAATAALTLAVATGCGGSSKTSTGGVAGAQKTQSSTLVGAGSTLVAPLMAQWQGPYSTDHGITVTYGAIGSGGGIEQITNRTVDFGASDAPLAADQAKACNGCVQLPWALAATTVSYNIPGLSKPLRLSGPLIADMYLGTIKTWNDPRIQHLNPGAKLPSLAIRPIYRSDASGDTYAFTSFLSHVSPTWKSKVGTSTSVSWPTGSGAPKNSGVTAAVQTTRGAVGYVAIGNAVGAKLTYADVQNKAGAFVEPSTKTIAAAAQTAHFGKDNSASIVDPPASAKAAYPISTFTYVIVPRSSSKLSTLKAFLDYAVTKGQTFAPALEFAPLPANVVAKDKTIIKGL